jgi:hypothetical protein
MLTIMPKTARNNHGFVVEERDEDKVEQGK